MRHVPAIVVAVLAATSVAQTAQPTDWEVIDIVVPERKHGPVHAPPPPSVPDVMRDPPEVTIDLAVRISDTTGASGETTVRMTRGKGRVHLDYPDRGQAWLFEQNTVDPRRALGILIDASLAVMLDHTEADLADVGIAQGWVDVGGFGVRPPDEHMVRTDQTRERAGVTFTKYTPANPQATNLKELWWSDELCAPLLVVIDLGGGRTRETEAVRIVHEADASVLRDPSTRLRSFQRMDVVDWREKHHGVHAHIPGVPCSSWAMRSPTQPAPDVAPTQPAQNPTQDPAQDPPTDR